MDDLDAVMERYHETLVTITNGDAGPQKALWSNREDVTLANPWGPAVVGWGQAATRLDAAASHFANGHAVGFERLAKHVSGDLACFVEVEQFETRIDRGPLVPVSLRVTTIFRREEGAWKVIHRHADPITTPRTGESLTQSPRA